MICDIQAIISPQPKLNIRLLISYTGSKIIQNITPVGILLRVWSVIAVALNERLDIDRLHEPVFCSYK